MAAPKAKTMMERAGFVDADLKTPAHDALMLWIDEYAAEILTDVFQFTESPRIVTKKWECPIKTERGHILGFADMCISASHRDNERYVFIEAKTKIPSLGELIRQVRYYQSGGDFSGYGDEFGRARVDWLVISPDNQFADILRRQGIHFYKPRHDIPGL